MIENRDAVNKWMERFGVRFGVYKNGVFKEQLFPFDAILRVISKEDKGTHTACRCIEFILKRYLSRKRNHQRRHYTGRIYLLFQGIPPGV